MQIFLDRQGNVSGLKEAISHALDKGAAKSLLILSCDGNGYTSEQIDPVLKAVGVPVFGGIFPVVLHGKESMSKGSVVVAMDYAPIIYDMPGMSGAATDFESMLDDMVEDDDEFETLMVFVDGLSQRIAGFIDAMYSIFGLEINYVGGGAGSLTSQQKPCVITSDGLKKEHAVLAGFPMRSGVGVNHGWTRVSGPYQVTESDHNVIKSLDWKPAFEVYKKDVEAHSGIKFVSQPFLDIAKAYPFGIAKMGAERIVRDPVSLDGHENLICVGEVPQGAYVDILHGNEADLVEAAGGALQKARDNFPDDAKVGLGLIMDCVSRMMFFGDHFSDELEAMASNDVEFIGACSIGEIANSGKDYLEFYNKTAVVAFLEGE